MAATVRQWSIREDGCLFISKSLKSVTYHSSLNSIILSSKDQTITVLDATSGIVLKKSDLSGQKCEALQCLYLPETDKCIFSDSHAVTVRRDFRGILLLDTGLQTPISRSEDIIKLEIPLVDAVQLSKALSSTHFEAGCDHLAEVTTELDRCIELARQDTEGSHKTAKWTTVCLQLQHSVLKTVCSALVTALKRSSQTSGCTQVNPGLPVASGISDRLTHLLPSSMVEVGPGLIDKALMYSEAARRQTFSKWPHMGYKWALPEPMAQAGFYHQPNAPGDDRAMCFTCNVCLVCWEPTDEPWSEHERHSPNCPYIKGDFTQNVPLSVTYATHPAQLHGNAQDKIACVSTTSNEDFVATSTRDGDIVVWDISHLLKKQVRFTLDLTDAIVALKTGLQIERPSQAGKATGSSSTIQDEVDSRVASVKELAQVPSTEDTEEQECVQEILLHHEVEVTEEVREERKRPSNDLTVSSLSIIDWSCTKEAGDHAALAACSPSKGSSSAETVRPSLVCGVSLLRTKCGSAAGTNASCSPKLSSSVERGREVVQMMNRVNEGVRNEDLRIIPDARPVDGGAADEFSPPESAFMPHLVVVTLNNSCGAGSSDQGKGKGKGEGGGEGALGESHSGKHKGPVPVGDDSKGLQSNSVMGNDTWSMLLENDPWLDPDVQIVGFTPGPASDSPLKDGPTTVSKMNPVLQNGPSELSYSGFGSEGSSPQSPNMHMPAELLSELKKKEAESQGQGQQGPGEADAKQPGMVLQCIPLPADLCSELLQVKAILPTMDRRYVIVVVSPHTEFVSDSEAPHTSGGDPVTDDASGGRRKASIQGQEKSGVMAAEEAKGFVSSDPVDIAHDKDRLDAPSATVDSPLLVHGGLLVYKVKCGEGRTLLEETPCMTYRVQQADHVIHDVFVLPPEVAEQMDEEELGSGHTSPSTALATVPGSSTATAAASTNGIGAIGQVSLILADGSMKILNLADARIIGGLSPEESDGFISATYCTGIERLCMCTWNGKLKFYQVSQQPGGESDAPRSSRGAGSKAALSQGASDGKRETMEDEVPDTWPGKMPSGDYLANGALVPETLTALHSLTQFENLMPRFTATVPPCWSEIQQEQQQRRHPQHLQQQGEATQHTRTWKLTQNGTTWDDHLFEIVLPKPCCVGHVDIKFALHPLCTAAPSIEVTLLKQNIGTMGHQGQSSMEEGEASSYRKSDAADKESVNYVLDPAFLQKNNAEILCGPMKLSNCMSGNSGLASLSSPKLLNSKPRSLLLHLKGFKNKEESSGIGSKGAAAAAVPEEKPEKVREGKKNVEYKTIKSLFEMSNGAGAVPSAVERLAASAPKQKLTDIKGCDWLSELSVTVRKFKRTSVQRERQQRNAMLETGGFQERLLSAITCPPPDLQGMNVEHFQNLALDILLWIGAIQVNDPSKRGGSQSLVVTCQPYLKDLVKSCFIDASRTTAHKCARLLALCIEYAKLSDDLDLAPSFSLHLLQALVDSLQLLVNCESSGAMKWFFTLLNRVKCMDASLVARTTTELLNAVAAQYHRNMSPLHSLLKTRFGLYGNPFDMDMFDVELPHNLRQPPSPPSTYASAAAKNTSTFGGQISSNAVPTVAGVAGSSLGVGSSSGGGGSSAGQSREEPDLFEMLNTPLEKSGCSQAEFLRNHVLGLLEVEPLSFSCHATSDGTRVERTDATLSHGPPGTSGSALSTVTLNMGNPFQDDPHSSILGTVGSIPISAAGAGVGVGVAGGGGATGVGGSSSGLVMADSLKKLAQMYTKQLPPSYKQIHQFISDHVNKAIESKQVHPPPALPALPTSSFVSLPMVEPPGASKDAGAASTSSGPGQQGPHKQMPFCQTHSLLQSPPDQVMVIERMHSGARRFVTLDFGKPIVLTDIIIPACADLASLSIDVWVQGEETDGQRLVVAADIGTRTLVMNNIMPAPICRYLKIITVGRYGAGTTRSRIPLGPFYGHSYILPWEWRDYADAQGSSGPAAKLVEGVNPASLGQQLGVFLSLQEDLQCRYSLACTRLSALLAAVADAQFVSSHVRYYLKRGQRKSGEDAAIVQSYNECLQLQLQLNLAQRAIARLQRAVGMKVQSHDDTVPFSLRLQQTSTDKLRVMVEGLLDTLLTLTVPSPSLPQPPHPLFFALPPATTESLFRNLCLLGSRRIQVSAGLLLSRVCGSQQWWGAFLGNVMREFFHSEYCTIFPQDRVFVLLSTLSQKALTGPSSVHILDSLLGMLTGVLQPLMTTLGRQTDAAGCLDLGLVSWILLFLCRNFDSALPGGSADDSDKSAKRDREANQSGRWSFIQGSWTGTGGSSCKSRSRKLYSRSMQKRILHHKQRLHDIETAKSMIEKAKDKVSHVVFKDIGSNKEKALIKEQESLKKFMAQLRSKHFKDLIYMRRNDLEVLRGMPKEEQESSSGKDGDDESSDTSLVLPRERCLLVVRGLMSLLLSMDFSCHVDLFLVACKVLAKICVVTRPALTLAEVMNQEQLEQLILLAVQHDNSHGPSIWGGPWASHAITCLLQDILEGEKQFPSSITTSEEDLLGTQMAEMEEQLAHSASSVNTDDGTDDDMDTEGEVNMASMDFPPNAPDDPSPINLMEDMLEDTYADSLSVMDIPPPSLDPMMYQFSAFNKTVKKSTGSSTQQNGEMDFMLSPPLIQTKSIGEKKLAADHLKKMKSKLNDLISTKSTSNSHGLSVAQDARLEFGLQWLPELRMRVMLSVHVDNVFGAFSSPLPTPPQLPHMLSEPSSGLGPTDDELSQASLSAHNPLSSSAMLSQCFNHLFAQLRQGRVSLDSVLQLWLTINQSSGPGGHDDLPPQNFNPARVPVVPVSSTAVVHLLEAVTALPMVSVRSWVFVLHTLCLMINQKLDAMPGGPTEDDGAVGGRDPLPPTLGAPSSSGLDSLGGMASVVLTDPNLVPLIIKFLSGSSANSPSSSGLQFYQVGPSATRAFDDFLNRLLCKSVDVNSQNLKELLLKIVYQLTADRGSVSACTGPLDAQCKFVDIVSGVAFDTVDVSNAISVVASISSLVHQHILCQDPIVCSASNDASISARSCFSGLFASLLRGGESRGPGGEAGRDQLMCSLLRLVNKLVQVPLPGTAPPRPTASQGLVDGSAGRDQEELQEGMSDAAKLNWAFSSSLASLPMSPMSDDEKRQQNSSGVGSGLSSNSEMVGGAGSSNVSESASTSGAAVGGGSEGRPTGDRYVADILLGNPLVMQSLVQALSFCSSNKMALILGSAPIFPSVTTATASTATAASSSTTSSSTTAASGNVNDNFNMADPLSVGDGVYQILCTLLLRATHPNAVTESLFKYLAGRYPQLDASAPLCRLSEPLLKFLLKVLDSPAAIQHFVELGGVEVVCNNLVLSSRQFISVGPSMISTIMQNMTSAAAAAAEEKAKAADADNVEGLFNFAPLGTIMSTSPTASPADALIQTSGPHRRARTAAWNYHFYPDEPWVELVITLPFAILLRQVQIRPHSGALTTCPSFVSLEISHDGQSVIPVSPPLVTCSLAVIKLQLLRPEVVSVVTLRLHRPRDSTTIGLQQVCLRGQRAFGEVAEPSSSFLPCEDTMARCSMGWLRLLHHCLLAHTQVESVVAQAAAPVPNLLNTCTSLLVSPATSLYSTKIECVLLRLGLSSVNIGLSLIHNILRNPAHCQDRGGGHIYLGRVNGVASPYTVEILYQLGVTQDSGTRGRVHALLTWLADSAQAHLRQAATASRAWERGLFALPDSAAHLAPSPASEHVHCVAAVLWYSHELPVDYDLLSLLTPSLVRHLYEWSSSLPAGCMLKKAVNHVLCSACHVHPPYFSQLLHWTGFLGLDHAATATDDSKDTAQQQQQRNGEGAGPLTDDSKEANRHPPRHQRQPGTMTDDSKEANRLSHSQQALSSLSLDRGQLESIAVVCRSPACVGQLLDSGLPMVLAQGLAEFCSRQITLILERNLVNDAAHRMQQSQQAGPPPQPDNGPRRGEWPGEEPDSNGLTSELVAAILSFFAELCYESSIKDWLGTAEGNVFWPALLTMLCNTSSQRPALSTLSAPYQHKVMSVEERFLIESTAIHFFTQVIACHSVNQLFFAKVLCDVIREQGAGRAGLLLGTVPLSGFTRRMLLQVLLEDEKVMVALRASPDFYYHLNVNSAMGSMEEKGLSCQVHHPCFGAGRGSYSVTVNVNSSCWEVLTQFGDPRAAAMVASSLLECRDDRKRAEELAKDNGDLGNEVMEYINAAGVLAKVKRVKSPSPSKAGLPPRPPTRRGHRASDSGLTGIKFPHCTMHLQHSLMGSKALPGGLTFSQLMQILLQRGMQAGTTALPFSVVLSSHTSVQPPTLQAAQQGSLGGIDEWGDNPEDIPDEILLASPAFPSALQVFASVGGLALLAQHLPLLYPDITRQGTTTDVSTADNNNVPDIGHEWVTVESSDELYDSYMEPVSPAPTSSHAARHVAGAMPTIPPHSLIAFGLFLRLPGYAEVLLKERKKAQCLLRLVLGVTDDGDGGHILTSQIAGSLPTLPFTVLKSLFDSSPLTTDDGVLLRRMGLDIGVLHLVLACLSVLSHHGPRVPVSGFQQETQMILTAMQAAASHSGMAQNEEKTQHYWAKGTGFGTGSTTSSWDAEQALLRQRSEEEHVACLLQVLGSYINPGGSVPKDFYAEDRDAGRGGPSGSGSSYSASASENKCLLPEVVSDLLSQSCLIPAISSYLRNDSVLDMARHVPLYRALLQLLRGMAVYSPLVPLLLPIPNPQSQQQQQQQSSEGAGGSSDGFSVSVEKLLAKMKGCVDTYASRLKSNKGKPMVSSKAEEEESEGLALLIPDIQETAGIVKLATQRLKDAEDHADGTSDSLAHGATAAKTTEEQYLALMGPLQFDTYELVTEEGRGLKFNIPHHFESNVKASGAFNNPSRTRRLAQEAVTLSTSLPLSYNSSVFVRCDEERLDIMKVLITGPSDTPYANGAFEFDVYFPQDYPNSPPYINLETTGNHTVRFNPNLYNDGKVCLSILNTWHGRPEEKWNAQTSSFLQVLVSIQSLILVSEPYFNEPGYERSRCTPSGTASSREYDANIRQATVKWAMLEQIRNVSSCFKEVVHHHFWVKRHEVLKQCEDWIAEMEQFSTDKRTGRSMSHSTMALKRHYNQLREELSKLKPPPELEQDAEEGETIDPKGKQYSTDSSQNGAAANTPGSSAPALPKPPSLPPAPSNLSGDGGAMGLGSFVGPNSMFFNNDLCDNELPDV